MVKKHLILYTFIVLSHIILGQSINLSADEIFREVEVAKMFITLAESDKTFLLDDANSNSNVYLEANIKFVNSLIDTTLLNTVGIRIRGNTSREHPKKSFKIDFKEFGGEKFFDHKKFNLRADNNDPSLTRELISLKLFRESNVAAARTSHTEVYINEEYMGLYLNVEQIDDEFVQSRFGNDDGNLYKCFWGANFENNGQVLNNNIYELELNEDINDRSKLEALISILHNSLPAEFESKLESVFNVQSFIRYMAVEALLGHWDAHSYNKNNIYLYENSETGKIELIAYDADNTFGIDWVGRDWGTRDVMDWYNHGDPRPLVTKILAIPRYKNQYAIELTKLLDGAFSEDYLFGKFDAYKTLIGDAIARDTYYSLTYGYTINDFNASFSNFDDGHVKYGLKDFVSIRSASAREQIGEITSIANPSKLDLSSLYPNPSNGKYINVKGNESKQNISVIDLTGKAVNFELIRQSTKDYQIQFDLTRGVYILTIDEAKYRFVVN